MGSLPCPRTAAPSPSRSSRTKPLDELAGAAGTTLCVVSFGRADRHPGQPPRPKPAAERRSACVRADESRAEPSRFVPAPRCTVGQRDARVVNSALERNGAKCKTLVRAALAPDIIDSGILTRGLLTQVLVAKPSTICPLEAPLPSLSSSRWSAVRGLKDELQLVALSCDARTTLPRQPLAAWRRASPYDLATVCRTSPDVACRSGSAKVERTKNGRTFGAISGASRTAI
jgi:hypothetical protein